jgi:GNAT superfamily N-acetyltransferase
MPTSVRVATEGDAESLASLLPHLGYEVSASQVETRLVSLLASDSHAVFVAEADGRLVGLCLASRVRHLASDGYVEIMELVVHEQHQRQGLGRQLLEQAESWAASDGASRVRLRSGVHRIEAHQFYERLGYAKARASYAFELTLGAERANSPAQPVWRAEAPVAQRLPWLDGCGDSAG